MTSALSLSLQCLFYHFSLTPTRCSIQPVKVRNHVRNAKRLMAKMMNGDKVEKEPHTQIEEVAKADEA